MDQERDTSPREDEGSHSNPPPGAASERREPTPLRTRILAGLGALLMVILVILYTYSIATGKIFAW